MKYNYFDTASGGYVEIRDDQPKDFSFPLNKVTIMQLHKNTVRVSFNNDVIKLIFLNVEDAKLIYHDLYNKLAKIELEEDTDDTLTHQISLLKAVKVNKITDWTKVDWAHIDPNRLNIQE